MYMASTSFQHMAVPQKSSEPRQIFQFWGATDAAWGLGCPIGIQQIAQLKIPPQNGPQNGGTGAQHTKPREIHEFNAT